MIYEGLIGVFLWCQVLAKSVFVSVVASAFEANHGNKSFGKMRNVIYCA
jgi:hypothetical protein